MRFIMLRNRSAERVKFSPKLFSAYTTNGAFAYIEKWKTAFQTCKCFENDRPKINDSKPLAVTSVSRGYGRLCSLLYRFVRGRYYAG